MTVHRIAFAGASGTGKTTLAKHAASALGLELQPSFARQVASEMGVASPYDVDALGRRGEFQRRVLDASLGWQLPRLNIGFVSDRSVWDNHAYNCEHTSVDEASALLMVLVRACNAAGIQTQQLYTRVVICPMDSFFVLGDDPARKQDEAYHRRFEKLLVQFLDAEENLGLPVDRSLLRFPAGQRARWLGEFVASLKASGSQRCPRLTPSSIS